MAISFRTELETALDQLIAHRRYFDFQKFAFHLAKQKWPALQATEPVHDLGSDGLIMVNGSAKLALACSVDGDLSKLRKDCKRLKEAQPTVETVIFATTRSVTGQTAKEWQKKIREEFGLNLEQVLGREWLLTEVEDVRMRWLCRDYLGMSGMAAEDDSNDLLVLSAASRKVLGSWREKYVLSGLPTIDLALELQSKERKERFRVSELENEVEAGCRLWIDGEPGGGKTHSITRLADTILSNRGPKLVPILVSLRALSQRGGSLLGYVSSLPAFQEQGLTETRLAQLAAKGHIIFLFNGWNEIAASQWSQTNDTIAEIVKQIPSAGIVVVSRPTVISAVDFSCRKFRLLTLSSSEIKSVLKQVFGNAWWSGWVKLRETQGLMELAAVPLFLQELIRELKLNSDLPLTRSAILGRMVARAVKEHAVALRDGCLKGNAERYLKQLGWDMTLNGRLDLSFIEACKSIAKANDALHTASMIGQMVNDNHSSPLGLITVASHEVTQGEYLEVVGSNPSYFRNGTEALGSGGPVTNEHQHPVETLSWNAATNYCGLLTERERVAGRLPAGYVYRLPTEAEWEYGCRAGTMTAFHYGAALVSGMANFRGTTEYVSSVGSIDNPSAIYLGRTTEVGSYEPNGWGLHDMHGNVWEWCQDWYGAYPAGPVTDPMGPGPGSARSARVRRGGFWVSFGDSARCANRGSFFPDFAGDYFGFRVVLTPGPASVP